MSSVPSYVEEVVEHSLTCSVRGGESPDEGRIAETYLLDLDDEPWNAVCKIGGPSVRTNDVIEPLVLELVGETTDLPVPEVFAHGTFDGRTGFGKYWALYEFCDGEVPSPFESLDPEVRRRVVFESGSILGELHATHQYSRTGGLCRNDDVLCICDPNGLYFPERGRELLDLHHRIDIEWQPVLSHGDLFPGNLLVDETGAVTGLLDWGNAHITTAGYALARAEMRFIDWFRFPPAERQRLKTELMRGYNQHRPLPPDYPSFGNFYKGLWLAQSTDRVCRHLLSSRGRQQMKQHLQSLLP